MVIKDLFKKLHQQAKSTHFYNGLRAIEGMGDILCYEARAGRTVFINKYLPKVKDMLLTCKNPEVREVLERTIHRVEKAIKDYDR